MRWPRPSRCRFMLLANPTSGWFHPIRSCFGKHVGPVRPKCYALSTSFGRLQPNQGRVRPNDRPHYGGCLPNLVRYPRRGGAVSTTLGGRQIWNCLAKFGWFGPRVPTEFGATSTCNSSARKAGQLRGDATETPANQFGTRPGIDANRSTAGNCNMLSKTCEVQGM